MPELLNVDRALDLILAKLTPLAPTRTTLMTAYGRYLAQDILAHEDQPPFACSSVDGYAVRAADLQGAQRDAPVTLEVVDDIPAGKVSRVTLGEGTAARIMTGAPLPSGADAVVMVEDTDSTWRATPNAPAPAQVSVYVTTTPGANVRPVGESFRSGQQVLAAQTRIGAPQIGVLAALGYADVPVLSKPRVTIFTSGDELVEVGATPPAGSIRESNTPMLAALVQRDGGLPTRLPIARDSFESVRQTLLDALASEPDLIVGVAGASVGTGDYTRAVLQELGEVDFWRINLRPGKPLAFGMVRGVPFFGLPGNPVSSYVTYEVLVRPALRHLAGLPAADDRLVTAFTAERLTSDGRRTYLRVTLHRDAHNRLIATTTGTQSSGALLSLALAHGLLIIPEDVRSVEANTPLTVKLLQPFESMV